MRRTVLIIDDSKTTRQFLRETLQDAGYVVVEAEDGQVALQRLSESRDPVDLAFCDVNMPNLDGFSFLGRLKTLTGFQALPVVMLTTEAGNELVARGKAAGARGWMVKPFRPERLLDLAGRFAPLA